MWMKYFPAVIPYVDNKVVALTITRPVPEEETRVGYLKPLGLGSYYYLGNHS
jgi:hypothetical protein